MNIYRHITLALLMAMPAAACMADDFDYDDDATVEITDDDWAEGDHDITIGIEDITTGVSSPMADVPQQPDAEVRIVSGRLMITTSSPLTIPLYRLDLPAAEFISIPAGSTTLELPHGIYIIAGRKYMV